MPTLRLSSPALCAMFFVLAMHVSSVQVDAAVTGAKMVATTTEGGVSTPLPALPAADLVPPGPPEVPPVISLTYPEDADGDAIADSLNVRLEAARLAVERADAVAAARGPQDLEAQAALSEANALTSETVEVELVFAAPIEQWQIDAFLALGGEITYIYQAVSYGWNGRVPVGVLDQLPDACGDTLVLVQQDRPQQLHMRIATQTGRVRPIWAGGFAGGGYDGDANISIAIVDTGLDDSHTDLAGRQVYWHDYSGDAEATPRDMVHHGSHVAGIALGTGASLGTGTTLYFTDSYSLYGVSSGYFYAFPFDFPAVSTTWTSTAYWLNGGTTGLYHIYRALGSTGGWSGLRSTSGSTGVSLSGTSILFSSYQYSAALPSNGAMTNFIVRNSMTGYSAVGDGFRTQRGVAPGCQWVGAKVYTNGGTGTSSMTSSAIDDLVANRAIYNIKVLNYSSGTAGSPGIDTTVRQKMNTAANNGILPVISAGNDGPGSAAANEVDDPGRAAMALTVGASNDLNALAMYTSCGFTSPGSTSGQEEDYKPDVLAPGGSDYYSQIMSVDSNDCDAWYHNSATHETSWLTPDAQGNDYTSMKGTSMAAPFAAGCAALVIDALQATGNLKGGTWSFAGSSHVRLVKMLLCATATETNANREVSSGSNPTLERAASGPSGFPATKDRYEGYGILNPDAAIEGGTVSYDMASPATASFDGTTTGRRAWARSVSLTTGTALSLALDVPASGDFDLYLYGAEPSTYGTPVLLASSTNATTGTDERLEYTPVSTAMAVLVVKRVSGSGTFSLADVTPPNAPVVSGDTPTSDTMPTWTWVSGGGGGNGTYRYQLDSEAGAWTETIATTWTPASPLADGAYTLYVQERDAAGNWSSSGSFAITIDTTPLTVGDNPPWEYEYSLETNGDVTVTDMAPGKDGPTTIPAGTPYVRFAGVTYNLFVGTNGDDVLTGIGTIEDDALGLNNADLILGFGGNDTLRGINGNDVLIGGAGNDKLYGDNGNDILLGGTGNDTLYPGAGDDFADGCAGNDLVVFANPANPNTIVYGGDGSGDKLLLADGYGSFTMMGCHGFEKFSGGNGDDCVDWSDATVPVEMRGNAGNDALIGGSGNDILRGSVGNDVLIGGTGNDVLYGEDGDDDLRGGAGTDTLYTGSGHDTADGGDGNNDRVVLGDAESALDSVSGGAGAGDELILENGYGTFEMDGPHGFENFTGGDGNDHIDWSAATVPVVLRGNGGDDTLTGGSGNDLLTGGAGNDVLYGGGGDDTLYGDDGTNHLIGGGGNDSIRGGGNDFAHFSEVPQAPRYSVRVMSSYIVVLDKTGADGQDIVRGCPLANLRGPYTP